MANKYMHLIEGKPAYFDEEASLIFAATHGQSLSELLEDSLSDIRRQQKVTREYRKRNGFNYESSRYSYLRVKC